MAKSTIITVGPFQKKFANPIKDYERLPLWRCGSVSHCRAPQAFLGIGLDLHLYSTVPQHNSYLLHIWINASAMVPWVSLKIAWRLYTFVDLCTFILSIWLLEFSTCFQLCLLQSKIEAINSFSLIVISFPASLLYNQLICFWSVTVNF